VAGSFRAVERGDQMRGEHLGVDQPDLALNPSHVRDAERAPVEAPLEQPRDAARPQPVVLIVQVADAAARAPLVQRIVVQRGADRMVVAVDDESGGRVHKVRHLHDREDLVRQRLMSLPGGVRVGPVLRADVPQGHGVAELVEIASLIEPGDGVELTRRAGAGVLQ
jgi:hypothetical protein